jgi:hypothetical protein
MTVEDKVKQIYDLIKEIETEDTAIASILAEGFMLSLNLIGVVQQRAEGTIDVSEHLTVISNILGVSLEDLIMQAFEENQLKMTDKPVDQATLDFITTDLDDYEKFLAQNKAKEELEFLSNELK